MVRTPPNPSANSSSEWSVRFLPRDAKSAANGGDASRRLFPTMMQASSKTKAEAGTLEAVPRCPYPRKI